MTLWTKTKNLGQKYNFKDDCVFFFHLEWKTQNRFTVTFISYVCSVHFIDIKTVEVEIQFFACSRKA